MRNSKDGLRISNLKRNGDVMKRQFGYGISVYPDFSDEQDMLRVNEYIKAAADLGYGEVFSSMHLPELVYTHNLEGIRHLGVFVRECGMDFTLDISGEMLRSILQNVSLSAVMKDIPISYLRLDYGYSLNQIKEVIDKFGIKGFMLNASVLTDWEIKQAVTQLKTYDKSIHFKACHNFYPRPETGLSLNFMIQRSLQYKPYEIPVTACVGSMTNPRLPLKMGLPTVEEHRGKNIEAATMSLLATEAVDAILIGDSFASADELLAVSQRCLGKPVPLHIEPESNICELERQIIFSGVHHSRPDAAACSIRSQTSRQMASPGISVPKGNIKPRSRYSVTIDNERYLRYSGELHIITKNLPGDERVNVVGHIKPQDYYKIDFAGPGMDFYFIT